MTPASAEATLATAYIKNQTDVPWEARTATFSHRNVRFTMGFPPKNIQCSGENHLVTSIVQCLEQGHYFCRDCQFSSSPEVLPEGTKCPLDGSAVVNDLAESRIFRHTIIPCPSKSTFSPPCEPACPWEGSYKDIRSHLDECSGIPDRTKLMMQDQRIKELQAQLIKSEEIHNTMIQSLTNLQRSTVPVGTLSPMESPDNTGKCVDVFLWKIDGLQSLFPDAVSDDDLSYYSPPVYTTGGYCVSGQICCYRHACGTSYLGLYIAIWKGQYDEQVSWPMSKIITASAVNQNNLSKSVGDRFASDDKPGFQNPPILVNEGWGFPKFLNLNASNISEFLKNDSLQIEIKLGDPQTETV